MLFLNLLLFLTDCCEQFCSVHAMYHEIAVLSWMCRHLLAAAAFPLNYFVFQILIEIAFTEKKQVAWMFGPFCLDLAAFLRGLAEAQKFVTVSRQELPET